MPKPQQDQSESEIILICEEEAGKRLDRILADRYSEVRSRTYFQNLIRDHNVLVNGEPIKKHLRPQVGDEVEVCFVLTPEIDIAPEPIPLEVIYEDDSILAINKPAGMVVHPAPGNWTGTFVNALLHHCKQLPGDFANLRPGIVHRLDKDTSGVLLGAKTPLAQQRLIELFSGREIYKEYLAVCVGNPGEGTVDLPIGRHPVHRKKMAIRETGGRPSVTHYKTLAFDGSLSIVRVLLETGRTHQIRVHLSHLRTPVLGDAVYGSLQANKKYKADRQLLHARFLRFKHPISHEPMDLTAALPDDIATFVSKLERSEAQ